MSLKLIRKTPGIKLGIDRVLGCTRFVCCAWLQVRLDGIFSPWGHRLVRRPFRIIIIIHVPNIVAESLLSHPGSLKLIMWRTDNKVRDGTT
jgi:hypothetical protein